VACARTRHGPEHVYTVDPDNDVELPGAVRNDIDISNHKKLIVRKDVARGGPITVMMLPDAEINGEKLPPDVLPSRLTNCAAWLGTLCVMAAFTAVFVTCTRMAATACAVLGTANNSAPTAKTAAPNERTDFVNVMMGLL
jgi:hypothetical protein